MSAVRAFLLLGLIGLQLAIQFITVSIPSHAGGIVPVKITPARIKKCFEVFERMGDPLPSDANIHEINLPVADWKCDSCKLTQSSVSANYPHESVSCNGCGSPMEPSLGELFFDNPNGPATMTEAQIDIALDRSGDNHNWTCTHCQAGGNSHFTGSGEIARSCPKCGAPRSDYSKFQAKNTAGAANLKFDVDTAEWVEKKPAPRPDLSPKDVLRMWIKDSKNQKLAAGLVSVLGLGTFTAVTLQDSPNIGVVTSARWIQTVRVEQYQPKIERGDCFAKNVMILEHLPSGKCEFETFKWVEVDSRDLRGNFDQQIPSDPSWAHLDVPEKGRISSQTRFDVGLEMQHNGETFETKWRPLSYEDFLRFKPQSTVTVEFNEVRDVSDVAVQEPGE